MTGSIKKAIQAKLAKLDTNKEKQDTQTKRFIVNYLNEFPDSKTDLEIKKRENRKLNHKVA